MRSGSAARGYALLLLLVLVAALGVVAAGAVQAGHNAGRRHAEAALLAAGDDFRNALLSWRRGGAPAASAGPAELTDLLRDPRVAGVRRHLRAIPFDPLTGRAEWGVLRDNAGRIVAVHSLAPGRPIKRQGFAPTQAGFDEAESYAQWRFGPVVSVRLSAAAASAARP